MKSVLIGVQLVVKTNKALYRHKRTGDLFAIETDETGNVLSTSGPLLSKDLNPEELDHDNYWDPDIRANINGFELLSEAEYKAFLKQTGFFVQATVSVTVLRDMASIPSRRFQSLLMPAGRLKSKVGRVGERTQITAVWAI